MSVLKTFLDNTHRRYGDGLHAAVLLVVFCVLAFQLRQHDLEFLVEADFEPDKIEAWKDFFLTFNPLPRPAPHVYLDGQFIVYGIGDVVLRFVASSMPFIRGFFPNDLSFALGSTILTNVLSYAMACTIFYCAMVRLTGSILISVLMAAGLFFAPQMININICRVDFLIMLPLMIVFYCSCMLALGAEERRHAVLLGIAMGFIATLKINGPFLGIIPATAALAAFRADMPGIKRLSRFTVASLIAFTLTYVVLMGRYFYYLSIPEISDLYEIAIKELKAWAPLMTGPPWYYNIDLMLDHGVAFVLLYLTCAAGTLFIMIRERSRPALYLLLLFVALSGAAALSPKYTRGGYHLLPAIFAMIGFAAAKLQFSRLPSFFKLAALLVGSAAFANSFVLSSQHYLTVASQRKMELVGIQLLKREPRDWLRAHVSPGTTICIQTSSQWTLPPLDGFNVTYGPLALPYLDAVALSHTYPPSLDEVQKSCPLILTSDTHRRAYHSLLAQASTETAAKWESFFEKLNARYPPVVFTSPVAIYARQININNLADLQPGRS
jgi:hypothetical protein